MSRADRDVIGFDYRLQRERRQPRGNWSQDLRAAIAAGGFRRVEAGETFAHGADARILFEVYERLPAPK